MARGLKSKTQVHPTAAPPPAMLLSIDIERKPALAAQVTERLREAIVFGQLKLGEAVSEDRLASLLNVSRTPVREALAALQLQGLIVIQPQRGSYVFQPTEQDIAELCEFRLMIETHALRLAQDRDRSATRSALERAQSAMEHAEASGDPVAAAKADADFHNALFAGCGNQILVQSYALVSGRIGAIRYFARGSAGSRKASSSGHRAIITAFAKADLAAAEAVLTTHVMNMRVHFSEALRSGPQRSIDGP